MVATSAPSISVGSPQQHSLSSKPPQHKQQQPDSVSRGTLTTFALTTTTVAMVLQVLGLSEQGWPLTEPAALKHASHGSFNEQLAVQATCQHAEQQQLSAAAAAGLVQAGTLHQQAAQYQQFCNNTYC